MTGPEVELDCECESRKGKVAAHVCSHACSTPRLYIWCVRVEVGRPPYEGWGNALVSGWLFLRPTWGWGFEFKGFITEIFSGTTDKRVWEVEQEVEQEEGRSQARGRQYRHRFSLRPAPLEYTWPPACFALQSLFQHATEEPGFRLPKLVKSLV